MAQSHSRHSCVRSAAMAAAIGACPILAVPTATLADVVEHNCKSLDVTSHDQRVHIRCTQAASGGIAFFAVSTANAAHAARILSILTAAHVSGKSVKIRYDPADTGGDKFGCAPKDCRTIISAGLL